MGKHQTFLVAETFSHSLSVESVSASPPVLSNSFVYSSSFFFVVISAFLSLHVLFPLGEVECPEDGKFRLVCASCSCLLQSCAMFWFQLKTQLSVLMFVVFFSVLCFPSSSVLLLIFFFLHSLRLHSCPSELDWWSLALYWSVAGADYLQGVCNRCAARCVNALLPSGWMC